MLYPTGSLIWSINILYSIARNISLYQTRLGLYGSPRECGISCIRSPYLSNQG